ncbi:similar to An17g01350 [Aspergillus niger]|uniref:Similar to An17g01350 n=1 Tax=Aspergillus niger TaxID=5061 RepID=A0A100IQD6_ASPNG|nr:similar to An17g01350 [Aspergillus niger]
MSNMSLSDSDLSSLSSAPPSDEETGSMAIDEPVGITKYFKKESESPPPKREPSPPHEYVLADNPDIAFIVMFRARFNDAFPRSTPHFGPQDVERGVAESPPGDHIERLLCAFLGLVLNRKKDVDRNHYQRPLEEAIQTHASQWPKAWQGKNPLHGGRTFATMSPEERLVLLKSLILWSLASSDAIQAKIKESYKQARHEDDLNQPLSVQPWGRDGLKRRYWLIEGLDDTHFRLYREGNPALKNVTWWSIAGNIPELKAVADRLDGEKSIHSKKLSERIRNSIPRFEGSEEWQKRKRRDYRIARKAAFARPEPGFSLYEGRTRGKKLKYTYSDDEDIFSDGLPSTRRSTRNTSGISTPPEPAGPRFTASGRQIRSRAGGLYGETLLSGQREDGDAGDEGRPTRGRTTRANGYTEYDDEEMDEGSEGGQSSGNEWQGNEGEEEEDNEFEGDDEEELSGDEAVMNGEPPSLVVQLRYNKDKVPSSPNGPTEEPLQQDPKSKEDVAKPVTATGAEDALQGQPPPAVNGQSSQPDVVAKTLPDAAPAAQDVTTTDTSAKADVSQPTATETKTQTA